MAVERGGTSKLTDVLDRVFDNGVVVRVVSEKETHVPPPEKDIGPLLSVDGVPSAHLALKGKPRDGDGGDSSATPPMPTPTRRERGQRPPPGRSERTRRADVPPRKR